MIDTAKIADAEQQAEIAKLQRDLSIAQNRLNSFTQKCERLEKDNDDLSQKLLVKAKREGESTVLMDRLSNMRTQLRDMERARDQATADAAELRAVMQQYVDQIQTIDAAIDPEEHEALRQELDMVREQARRDLKELQEQLDQQASEAQSVDSDNVIETEALRQEHEVLSRSLSDRTDELQTSQHTCQLLEDELEDAHAEIDELRRQLEKQAEEIKQQTEEKPAVDSVEEILAENISDDDEIAQSVPVLDIKAPKAGLFSARSLMLMLAGIGIAVAALEAFSFKTGKGELFQFLMEKNGVQPVQEIAPVTEPVEHEEIIPDHSTEDILSGQIRRE